MKFRNFLGVADTSQQAYYKDSVELIFPNRDKPIRLAILPAYDQSGSPTGWVPAADGCSESDFYTVVRAAKFVGHGNRRAKVAFLSPKTFDPDADDPYEAFVDYCSSQDKWKYLTKDNRGKRLTGEPDGPIFPAPKNLFVANVMDVDAGSRGGVYVTELSENVMRSILYTQEKSGRTIYGLALQRDESGSLVYGDITNPKDALVIEIGMRDRKYVARAALDDKGVVMRTEIPEALLPHRLHMEDPETFLIKPESGQEIVDRLAARLRGYKSPDGEDEINALKEAMEFAYGKDRFVVFDDVEEDSGRSGSNRPAQPDDPFGDVDVVAEEPEAKAEAVDDAIERGVERERYTPPENPPPPKQKKSSKTKARKQDVPAKATNSEPEFAPSEMVSPDDIASIRAMLAGGE